MSNNRDYCFPTSNAQVNNISLADRMARIVAESKESKKYTDNGQMSPEFAESTKNMSDEDKTNLLVMMDNIASNHSQIEIKRHENGGQEILFPLSIFKGIK